MKLRNLGSFVLGVGGMAWAALHLSQEALILIGLIGFALGLFCAGVNWGEYLVLREKKKRTNPIDHQPWMVTLDE